jgi:hypothetical protein
MRPALAQEEVPEVLAGQQVVEAMAWGLWQGFVVEERDHHVVVFGETLLLE